MKKLFVLFILISIFTMGSLSQADEGKLNIYYEGNAQVELISPQGSRVLIDVYDPSLLSAPATAKDILLTTHGHTDHVSSLSNNFPGQALYIKSGSIKTADLSIVGIPSSHNQDNSFMPEKGSNYIFIIDIAGLRIAHFGDIGQQALTPEQLSALGKVDIAITQLSNMYSNMDIDNLKGFNIIDQVKPKMIITTHDDIDTAKYAAKLWQPYYSGNPLKVGPTDFGAKTKLVFVGDKKKILSKIVKASPWTEGK
jgi:L-ascorbate metabolism protein UlaG (beta-lactamase superfamily)